MPEFVHGIDVSNYQPRDLSRIIEEHHPAHVVVRLFLPQERPPEAHSMAQINSARDNGCSVGAYVWAYGSLDPRQTVRDAVGLARRCELEPPVLWIDCETYVVRGKVDDPGPDANWLRAAAEECHVLGVLPAIYTGGWWWHQYMDNTTEFADLPLWTAHYDEIADLDQVTLFGGWERARGKQWSQRLPNGRELDRDVFLQEVCVARPTLETLDLANPGFRQQLEAWQQARLGNGEDPHNYASLRQHLLSIGAPDPGPVEFVGFRVQNWTRLSAGVNEPYESVRRRVG
ncbi:MAG: hypothetical protein EPO21_01735 [Chloroflexota bacterium]|nr:MAG: hypothetical protein EPO21_01735 [Chloroflexota bacterium]